MPQSQVFQRPISIGLPPTVPQGARITTPLVLTSSGNNLSMSIDTADLAMEDAEGVINNVQTMFVDASNTVWDFVITFPETQRNFYIIANTQGYYPIAVGPQCQIQAQAISTASIAAFSSVSIQFLNVPLQPCVWSTVDQLLNVTATTVTNGGNTAITVSFNDASPFNSNYQKANVWGIEISGTGATASGDVTATLTGCVGNTISWDILCLS